MYYGNSIAGNNSNGADTFLFFDDFSSQSYFDNYWTYPITAGSGATFTVSDGYLTINGGSAPNIATSPDIGLNDYTIDITPKAEVEIPVKIADFIKSCSTIKHFYDEKKRGPDGKIGVHSTKNVEKYIVERL